MSSLIPERQLIISPSLATTIGLEEAVLLQVLNDVSTFGQATERQGLRWISIDKSYIQSLLPFWNDQTLQLIYFSLRDKGIIVIDSNNNTGVFYFAMNEPVKQRSQQINQVTQTASQSRNRKTGAYLLEKDWQPDEELLQILTLNHAIPREFALAQLEDFILYWHTRGQVSHSWPSKFRQNVLKQWRFHQSKQAEATKATSIATLGDWAPSHEALEILQRDNVSKDFIEDAVPEFVLYWRERGESSNTWNSKFIRNIRRQWAIYTKTMELDYEPREIAANWQPNEDVYDILRLANIDLEFARQQISEFVLFWRDTKEIKRSWNTVFLQQVRYKWATQHHMGQHYAGPQKAKSTFEHLTDRSWAEGLVEDEDKDENEDKDE